MSYLVFAFAATMSIVNFFAEVLSKRIEKFHSRMLSFSSGVFVAYFFLTLLPETFKASQFIGENAFFLPLVGFILFHVLEKYFYQHVKNKKKLLEDLSELHTLGFFIDHFIAGMILFFVATIEDVFLGTLIILPLLLHVVSSSISLSHIFEHFNKNRLVIILLSIAPFLGTVFAFVLNSHTGLYFMFFSFSMGPVFYIIIRDLIPNDTEKTSVDFMLGVILIILLITITKSIAAAGLAGLISS